MELYLHKEHGHLPITTAQATLLPYQRITVFTDGGCQPNAEGPGGWGVAMYADGKLVLGLYGGCRKKTTNNRMEIVAAMVALEACPSGATIRMNLDSQYVIKSITRWIATWKRNDWMSKSKGKEEPVKNADFWRRLDELAIAKQPSWHWVSGHGNSKGNIYADRLAFKGRQRTVALGVRACTTQLNSFVNLQLVKKIQGF